MRHQRGVALITVMLVFVIISILCSQMIRQTQSDIERSRWLLAEAQAYQYALGAENLARQLLWQQATEFKTQGITISPIPHLLPVYHPEHGSLSVELVDLQGRLNLNDALFKPTHQRPLENLFSGLLMKPFLASELSDWLDDDLSPRPGGAEDYSYLNLRPSYRTASNPMLAPSELVLLAGLTPKELTVTAPYVATLPEGTGINPNTASAEVLSLLDNRLSGEQIVAFRETSPPGFLSINDFLTANATAGIELNTNNLTVTSTYYAAKIVATYGDQEVHLLSRFRLDLEAGTTTLMDRTLGDDLQVNTRESENSDQEDEAAENSLF